MTDQDARHQRTSSKRPLKEAVSDVSEVVDLENEKYDTKADITKDLRHGVAKPMNELEEHVNDMDNSWETESLLADMLEDLTDDKNHDSPDCFSADYAAYIRHQLRALGPEMFCRNYLDSGNFSAKKLLTAFGVRPPEFLEGQPDESYRNLLILAISRELSKRAKLASYNTVDDAVELLKKSKNIIVLTGAGISTSLGIPDFRSAGTGLYSKLEHLGLNDPQEVFNITVFKEDPSIFFSVARDILPETDRFTPTHRFIAMLQEKGKLLTNYSQNIDNLESKAGISSKKLIQCHGSFATASCIQCGHQVPGETIFPDIKSGQIPYCPKCAAPRRTTKNSRKRKLARDGTEKKVRRRPGEYDSASDSEYDMPSKGGIMKPDITFFGEALPDAFSKRLVDHDRFKTDLVVVIGTSLKVAPVSELVPFLPAHIPQIYISRTPVNHHNFDIDLLGDCDVVVAELCRRAGWDLTHEMVPEDQTITVTTQEGWRSRHVFSTDRPSVEMAPAGASDAEVPAVRRLSASNADGDEDNGLDPTTGTAGSSTGKTAVTTTRSGRRSGRVSPK